ncbi:MAG: hypothetical protein R3B67_02465 [Phycisphaerales bacterium]
MLGVEEDSVVVADGVVGVVLDLSSDADDATREGGDLDLVGEVDAGLGLFLVFVLADEDASG